MSTTAPKKKKLKIRLILIILMSRIAYLIDADQSLGVIGDLENEVIDAKQCIESAASDDSNWSTEEIDVGDIIEELAGDIATCDNTALSAYSSSLGAAIIAWKESL